MKTNNDGKRLSNIAFISDIHSNLEALEAVLSKSGGAEIYCLGDVVGYGPNPNEVVARLKDKKAKVVMGNHDLAVVSGDTGNFNARAAMAAVWTRGKVSDESVEFLRRLPSEIRAKIGGTEAYMTHGSPDDPLWEYVLPESHENLFPHYLAKVGADMIALGHTHVPYLWKKGDVGTVFNPGSVGQPRDGDPRASFALVTLDGPVKVELHRVDYNVGKTARKIIEAGLPKQLADRLSSGI